MPKASSGVPNAAVPAPNILKRNQACHQCRRRKLVRPHSYHASISADTELQKCDAQRPCATCIRSHANARATSGAASVPPYPECTYDEIPEPRQLSHEPPKNRYERLEGRINELESMLRQKDLSLQAQAQAHAQLAPHRLFSTLPNSRGSLPHDPLITQNLPSDPMYMNSKTPTHARSSQSFDVLDYNNSPGYPPVQHIDPSDISIHSYFSNQLPDHGPLRRHTASSASVSSLGAGSSLSQSHNNSQPSPPTAATNSPAHETDLLRDLFWPSWPARLPTPELLQHLVGVFFSSLPHASRVLHKETFLASLSLLPTASGFPETSILHAICAVASLFTSAITSPAKPNYQDQSPDDIFEKFKRPENLDDSFGEMQAKYAKEAQEESTRVGEGLFASLQSVVILNWYYFYHARWVDVWLTSGEALRYCVPLGLNICEPQVPLIRSWKSRSAMIPPSRGPIEEETRRNIFWLAYAMDRAHAAGTDFAMTLDDEDITQVLPCLSHDFARGDIVPTDQRQRLTSSRVLTNHIPEHTDSFVLYIKAMVLLSKVKIFNQRFKAKFQTTQGDIDPRDTSAFKGLDTVITSFISSFPEQYKDPISNGVVDSDLYVAYLVPHAATLLLHDPHADCGDRSHGKLTVAAHAILDLVYLICSTNYDITLLDPTIIWCWSTAAQELVHEMQHMRQTGQSTQVAVLRSEIEVIRMALVRLGERLPLGYCQAKLLDDLLAQDVPGCTVDSNLYNSHYMEDVDPGSLEQLMYDGMR